MSEKVLDRIESVNELRAVADAAAVYMYVTDYLTDEILMVNDHYTEHLGVDRSRMEGLKCWEFVNGEGAGRCGFCPRDFNLDGNDTFDPGPITVEAFNPTLGIWSKWTGRGITWVDGRQAHVITMIDVSEEKLLREELSNLAYYDKRLGIPNRARIEEELRDRPEGNYCLITFDYISLRHINDAYGKPFVNKLIEAVVKWIKSFELQNYEIYRVDNDEFCILLDNADMMSASGLADRIHERFGEPWEITIGDERATISCRVAVCVIDGRIGFQSPEDVLTTIDRTLEIAKESQTVVVYDKNLDDMIKYDRALEVSLKNCVLNDMQGFEVYFQPIVDPKSEKWIGLEALCRWQSPEFGRIPPLVFIKIAEKIGVINKIGYWVLDMSVEICAKLDLCGIAGFFLGVNLSPSQMSDEKLINKILLSLQTHAFPAHCLSLEMTESKDIEEANYSHTIIERLRSLDIKVAMDDYGTGYSNFNKLRTLPVRMLKTEKQLIDTIADDPYQKYLTKVLIELAHEAEMSLVSEGVETEEQVKELMKNGMDYLQGFLFAMPLSVEELTEQAYRFRETDPMFERLKAEIDTEDTDGR